MEMSEFGPLAAIIAAAAALAAAFSLLLLKAVGRVAKWTWLIDDAPSFLVTAGARALAVALIGVTFITINSSNYTIFAVGAVLFGIAAFILIARFDRVRKTHTCRVPIVAQDGNQAIDAKGKRLFKTVAIGLTQDMKLNAKEAYEKLTGVSRCKFMSGFGKNELNDPAAIWNEEVLAAISNRMTITLMGILLSAVMALYLAASAVEVHQRPVVEGSNTTP